MKQSIATNDSNEAPTELTDCEFGTCIGSLMNPLSHHKWPKSDQCKIIVIMLKSSLNWYYRVQLECIFIHMEIEWVIKATKLV